MNQQIIDPALIDKVCQVYQIGELTTPLTLCTGGLLHRSYQFETTKGHFIIKLLNPTVIKRPRAIERYRLTEQIAQKLGDYIPAICAITHNNDPLNTLGTETMMLFHYFSGKTLPQNKINSKHVAMIGQTVAKMHQAAIHLASAPEVELPKLELLAQDQSIPINDTELISKFNNCKSEISHIYKNCQEYTEILSNNLVISHRDCDPKNVLWADDQHFVIDWESAGLINKTKDTLVTAMYWSLDSNFKVNMKYLSSFLKSYYQEHPRIDPKEIRAGLYGLLGDWLSWLDFNLARIQNAPETSEEFKLGLNESNNTLTAIPIVLSQFPVIFETIYST